MPTNFPTGLDTFPDDPTLAAENLSTAPHSALHANLGDSVLALEVKVGINGSANTASIDYIMSHMTEGRLSLSDVTTGNVTSSLHGFAPKAPADATQFLNGATTPAFAAVKDSDLSTSDVTTNNVSTTKHGFAPKAPNDATKFLDGTGAYSTPASGGSPGGSNSDIQFNNAGNFGGAANVTYTTTDPVGNPALILAANTALDLTATAGVQRALLYSGNTLYVGQIDNSVGATYIGYGTSLSLVYGNATNQGPSTVATHWDATGQCTVTSLSATNIPLTVKGAASQSGHLLELQESTSTWRGSLSIDSSSNFVLTANNSDIVLTHGASGAVRTNKISRAAGTTDLILDCLGDSIKFESSGVLGAYIASELDANWELGSYVLTPSLQNRIVFGASVQLRCNTAGSRIRVVAGGNDAYAFGNTYFNANRTRGASYAWTPGSADTTNQDVGFESPSVGIIAITDGQGNNTTTGILQLGPVAAPATPSTGVYLYVDVADGKLKAKGSSGTVTTLANP